MQIITISYYLRLQSDGSKLGHIEFYIFTKRYIRRFPRCTDIAYINDIISYGLRLLLPERHLFKIVCFDTPSRDRRHVSEAVDHILLAFQKYDWHGSFLYDLNVYNQPDIAFGCGQNLYSISWSSS